MGPKLEEPKRGDHRQQEGDRAGAAVHLGGSLQSTLLAALRGQAGICEVVCRCRCKSTTKKVKVLLVRRVFLFIRKGRDETSL